SLRSRRSSGRTEMTEADVVNASLLKRGLEHRSRHRADITVEVPGEFDSVGNARRIDAFTVSKGRRHAAHGVPPERIVRDGSRARGRRSRAREPSRTM